MVEGVESLSGRPASSLGKAEIRVIQDIYHMKTVAVEVVAQLAADHVRLNPNCGSTTVMLARQVQEEFAHLHICQDFLWKRGVLGERPLYVGLYAQLMKSVARRRRRFFPLAIATVLCVAVEVAAFKQLSEAAPDGDFQELCTCLNRDEYDHFELVARVIAPGAAGQAKPLEKIFAYVVVLGIVLITACFWWPRQMRFYEASGLNVDFFGKEVINLLSPPMEKLRLFFSPPWLRRSVEFALRRKIDL